MEQFGNFVITLEWLMNRYKLHSSEETMVDFIRLCTKFIYSTGVYVIALDQIYLELYVFENLQS